jgi:GDP-L-fucose synthase
MKVLLTGGNGFLGKEIQRRLTNLKIDFVVFGSSEYDLRDFNRVQDLFKKVNPTHVINAAARLGGIGDNQASPVDYFRDNILIGMNVMEASNIFRVQRLVQIGTVCSYPKITPVPFKESDVWNGMPEGTNAAYGIAKRSLIALSQAYQKQYGLQTVNLLLANLYGPGDDFRDQTSHVIPALIKKIEFAKSNGLKSIEVWGDGSPTRDFLFVRDAARAIINALMSEKVQEVSPINVATGIETSIREVVAILTENLDFEGEVVYDTSRPNGQPIRVLDVNKALSELDFAANTSLNEGITDTIEYYFSKKQEIEALTRKYD